MQPYYLQRGMLKDNFAGSVNKYISDYVVLSNMVSGEFENCACLKSIFRTGKQAEKYDIIKTHIENMSSNYFYVYSTKKQYKDVVKFILNEIRNERRSTVEYNNIRESFLEPKEIKNDKFYKMYAKSLHYKSYFTNFWWDIKNDFGIILGDEKDIKNFREAIDNTYAYYNKKYANTISDEIIKEK